MNITNISRNSHEFKYAFNIIFKTPKFVDFAIAILDYMGEDYKFVQTLYIQTRDAVLESGFELDMNTPENVESFTPELIKKIYLDYKKKRENKNRQQEFKENIDELQFFVKKYREKDEFKKMLEFVGRFHYVAPYNALLIRFQRPGATFVLNGKKWEAYNRRPKINAQKIITLIPFGPTQCMFDFEDTEPINEDAVTKGDLIEEFYNKLQQQEGEVNPKKMDSLIHNLSQYGIYLDDSFDAAATMGGYIREYTDKKLTIFIKKDHTMSFNCRFNISINKNMTSAKKFSVLCHELGHLFCRHLYYNNSQQRDNMTTKEEEFEAETVAWLLCKRQGINNHAEEYLATYAPTGKIPICSTETIMKAVTEIEKMMTGKMNIKDTLWYKEDKTLKEAVDNIKNTVNDIQPYEKNLPLNN